MPVPSPPIRGEAPEGTPIDVNRALPCSLPSGETRTQVSRKQAFIARTTTAPAGRTSSAVVGPRRRGHGSDCIFGRGKPEEKPRITKKILAFASRRRFTGCDARQVVQTRHGANARRGRN